MTNYSNGANFERKIKKQYEDDGWFVVRSAGSKGPVDLVAIHVVDYEIQVDLIQCKTRKPTKSERDAAIVFVSKYPGVDMYLVWPNGKEHI